MSDHLLGRDATDREPKGGFESVKQVVLLFRTAFPDMQCPLYDLLAEGDKVAARWGLRGAHRGAFMGVAPTGKSISVTGMIVYRLEDQKIVEYWGTFDTLGLMRQIGAA